MEWKAEIPLPLLKGKNADAIIQAYFEFSHLKQLYRQGWLKRGIPKDRCESVADHSFGVAVLAFWLAEAYFPELDSGRVIRIALLHDFGEIYAGDIIPGAGISAEQKHQLEHESVARVFARLPQGEAYLALWEEYEHGASAEARFVKEIDRLEMALQASVYEQQGPLDLSEFFESAGQTITDPRLVRVLDAIRALHD